jgi:hypothetical protein
VHDSADISRLETILRPVTAKRYDIVFRKQGPTPSSM